MDKYANLSDIIEEIEGLLDLLFMGGLYTIQKDMVERLRGAAERSGRYGLAYGEKLLARVAGGLEARRHSAAYDYTGLIDDYCKLSLYVSVLKSKIEGSEQ